MTLSPKEEKAAMRNTILTQCLEIVALGTTVNGVDVGATTDVTIMWTKGKASPQVVEFLNTDCGAGGCPK